VRDADAPLLVLTPEDTAGLSPDQLRAVEAVQAGRNVFLTGRGGCGKTMVLKTILRGLQAADTPVAVTATTGIAAEPLHGTTVHKFACLAPGSSLEDCVKTALKYGKERIREPVVLIIDEISMMSKEEMGRLLHVLHAVRGKALGLPKLILSGDFLQLAPVSGAMLLGTDVWASLGMVDVVLRDNWRQKGQTDLLAVLDEVRMGEVSAKGDALLRSRLGVTLSSGDIEPTKLMPRVADAQRLNLQMLEKLPGEATAYRAEVFLGTKPPGTGCAWEPVRGCVEVSTALAAPTLRNLAGLRVRFADVGAGSRASFLHDADKSAKDANAEPLLHLKVGAQVLFTDNVSQPLLMNGTAGVVTKLGRESVYVRLLNGQEVLVLPFQTWKPFGMEDYTKAPRATVYSQLPLRLSWAITIHRSQGMSLDFADVDLGRDVFAPGQGYVALSRVRTLDGLRLSRFEPSGIRADPEVVEWYRSRL